MKGSSPAESWMSVNFMAICPSDFDISCAQSSQSWLTIEDTQGGGHQNPLNTAKFMEIPPKYHENIYKHMNSMIIERQDYTIAPAHTQDQ